MRADRTHRTYRSPTRALSKPRRTPGPNCGSLVREGISEGRRAACQAASASTFVSSASGRTASAAPSKSLFSTKRAGSRGPGRVGLGAEGTNGAKGRATMGSRSIGQHRSPSKEPRSPRRAESSGKRLRAALAAITARATIRRRPCCISTLQATTRLPAKAGIQPWDTTKRRHMPRSRRERRKRQAS